MSDLSAFRQMLDDAELCHETEYLGVGDVHNLPHIAIKTGFNMHDHMKLVIEFDSNGKFAMFDLEEVE